MIRDKRVSICIPARYASTRLPGKPLIKLGKKTLIEHVVSNALQSKYADNVFVLTDDSRIYDFLKGKGINVEMTGENHESGTSRIIEFIRKTPSDIIVNIQGDEPDLQPEHIDSLIDFHYHADEGIGTLVRPIRDPDQIFDYNLVKVVISNGGEALYFSRQAIPAVRDQPYRKWHLHHEYLAHVGVYIFDLEVLHQISNLSDSSLSNVEKLEQLQWLEHGLSIKCLRSTYTGQGIDTTEDLERWHEHNGIPYTRNA